MTGGRHFTRVASGDYETADGRYRLYRLAGVHPPAWNLERVPTDDEYAAGEDIDLIVVDGAATKRDALALFAAAGELSWAYPHPPTAGARRWLAAYGPLEAQLDRDLEAHGARLYRAATKARRTGTAIVDPLVGELEPGDAGDLVAAIGYERANRIIAAARGVATSDPS